MGEHGNSEWDRILSQRLSRESQRALASQQSSQRITIGIPIPPPAKQPGPQGQEISAEGEVLPHGPDVAAAPVQETYLWQSQPVSDRETWITPPPPGTRGAAGGPPGAASDPAVVVNQLRQLSPQEERRAIELLSGASPRSRTSMVIAASALAAIATAAVVLTLTGAFRGERELVLASRLSPPDETLAATPPEPARSPVDASPAPAIDDAGAGETLGNDDAPAQTPPEPDDTTDDSPAPVTTASAGDGEQTTPAPEQAPSIVAPEPGPDDRVGQRAGTTTQSLAVRQGPTFGISLKVQRRTWVADTSPPLDLSGAPSVRVGTGE